MNTRVLKLLEIYFILFPTETFFQALFNLGLVDAEPKIELGQIVGMSWRNMFHEEDSRVVQKIEKAFKDRELDLSVIPTSELENFIKQLKNDTSESEDPA